METNCLKSSDTSNFSDIEEKIIKKMKPFWNQSKTITKKHFVSEEENNCEEEIDLTPQ